LVLLASLSQEYTFYRFQPKEIIATGDIVWAIFDVGLFYDPKGEGEPRKHMNLEMAVRWRLEGDKIVEHQAFFDTASLLMQQGKGLDSS